MKGLGKPGGARMPSPRSLGCPFPTPTSGPDRMGRPGQLTKPSMPPTPASLLPRTAHPHARRVPGLPSSPYRNQSPENNRLVEGCFCPDGHTLFNSHTDVCVPKCRKHHPWPGPLTQPCRASGWDVLAWPGLPQCQTTCHLGPAPTPFALPVAVWPGALPSPLLCGSPQVLQGLLFPVGRQRPWLGVGVGGPRLRRHVPAASAPQP